MQSSDVYVPTALRPPKPRIYPVRFAIGIEHRPNEFGMTDGPAAQESEMLEVIPSEPNSFILRFNADGTHDRLWRWENNAWHRIKPEVPAR